MKIFTFLLKLSNHILSNYLFSWHHYSFSVNSACSLTGNPLQIKYFSTAPTFEKSKRGQFDLDWCWPLCIPAPSLITDFWGPPRSIPCFPLDPVYFFGIIEPGYPPCIYNSPPSILIWGFVALSSPASSLSRFMTTE